jgi:hypothetical protein
MSLFASCIRYTWGDFWLLLITIVVLAVVVDVLQIIIHLRLQAHIKRNQHRYSQEPEKLLYRHRKPRTSDVRNGEPEAATDGSALP